MEQQLSHFSNAAFVVFCSGSLDRPNGFPAFSPCGIPAVDKVPGLYTPLQAYSTPGDLNSAF